WPLSVQLNTGGEMVFSKGRSVWRTFSVVAVSMVMLLGVVACGDNSKESGGGSSGGSKTVKIGVLFPYTGTFGIYGPNLEAAIKTRLAEADVVSSEYKIELIIEDDATDAKTAVTKATKMIEEDGV